jgi:hypothetical protein
MKVNLFRTIMNLTVSACLLCSPSLLNAQSFFRVNWEKSIDLNQKDRIIASVKTFDGNFILAGETSLLNVPGQKILLVKINPAGEIIWQKVLGGQWDCRFKSLTLAANGDICLLGTRQQGASNPFVYTVKTDMQGKMIWESNAGGGGIENIYDIVQTSEGGVFLCGGKQIKGNNDSDGWLVKLSKKGIMESQVMIGASYIDDEFRCIIPDNSTGFFLAGISSVKLGGEKLPYLVHIDFRGNKTWEKLYPEQPGGIPSGMYINSDGLIVCLMNTLNASGDFVNLTRMVVDQSGALISSYNTPRKLNAGKNSFFRNVNDELLMFSVQEAEPTSGSELYMIKLDQELNPVWISRLDMENVSLSSVNIIDDLNYLVSGTTGPNSYKSDIKLFAFRDYSQKLIDTYLTQNLIASEGMNVSESLKDFKIRIGEQKFESLALKYKAEASVNLHLVPESNPVAAPGRSENTREPSAASPDRPSGGNPETLLNGRYYALLIAVEDYQDPAINDLDKPIKDAQKLYDVLVNEYLFEKADVTFLKNPTREQIIATLDMLEKKVTRSDNLLIFYAGHGYWSETTEKGYWLPSDASRQNTSNWIGNSSVSDYIRSIPAKHTLLIADACFSGSIFKTRAAFGNADMSAMKLYELPSRKAMTSGTLTEVPDKSVFIDFLVKRLYENQDHFLSSEQLFFSFKPAVVNNTESIPQFGVVGNAGDEGGDFIFVKRKAGP